MSIIFNAAGMNLWFGEAPEGLQAPKDFTLVSSEGDWLKARHNADGQLFFVNLAAAGRINRLYPALDKDQMDERHPVEVVWP